MSRIARNSVNGRLNRNTFCSGAEVVSVQCKRGLRKAIMLRSSLRNKYYKNKTEENERTFTGALKYYEILRATTRFLYETTS